MCGLILSQSCFRWLPALLAILLVFGGVCQFSGDAHAAALMSEHEGDQSGGLDHHGSAHLISCDEALIPASSEYPVGYDVAAPALSLEALVGLLQDRVADAGRSALPHRGTPLFLLHAALLI